MRLGGNSMKNLQKEQSHFLVRKAASGLIRFYQSILSPDTGVFGSLFTTLFFVSPNSGCRFVPSCSDYARESISQYGLFRGSVMCAKRLLRWHSFSHDGFDPVNGSVSGDKKYVP